MIDYGVEFDILLHLMDEWEDLLCFINFLVVDNFLVCFIMWFDDYVNLDDCLFMK